MHPLQLTGRRRVPRLTWLSVNAPKEFGLGGKVFEPKLIRNSANISRVKPPARRIAAKVTHSYHPRLRIGWLWGECRIGRHMNDAPGRYSKLVSLYGRASPYRPVLCLPACQDKERQRPWGLSRNRLGILLFSQLKPVPATATTPASVIADFVPPCLWGKLLKVSQIPCLRRLYS